VVTKQQIIDVLKTRFENDPLVFAFWLEGSDAVGGGDELSYLDLVMDVQDSHEEAVLAAVGNELATLGELDLVSPIERPNAFIWYQVFHIRDSSEFLLIDASMQRHSRDFVFTEGDPDETPKVIFDKANAVRIEPMDPDKRQAELAERLRHARARFARRIGVRKYIKRGNFLETWAYYDKFVLKPLVEVLRIRYRPGSVDYGLVHASRHFPAPVVRELEALYQVNSLDQFPERLQRADKLFRVTLAEVEGK